MAFLNERNIAIGNALTCAHSEVINAIDAKAMDIDKTMLWHIYKAQKALEQAAALLVEDNQAESSNDSAACYGCEQSVANDCLGTSDTADCPTESRKWLQVTDKIVAASEDAQKMRKALIKYLQHKIVEEDMLQDIINSTNNIERSEQ